MSGVAKKRCIPTISVTCPIPTPYSSLSSAKVRYISSTLSVSVKGRPSARDRVISVSWSVISDLLGSWKGSDLQRAGASRQGPQARAAGGRGCHPGAGGGGGGPAG